MNGAMLLQQHAAGVIEGLGQAVIEAKRVYPGAAVTAIRTREIDWERGDEMPL